MWGPVGAPAMGRGVERLIVDRGGCCLGADAIDDDPYVGPAPPTQKVIPVNRTFLASRHTQLP